MGSSPRDAADFFARVTGMIVFRPRLCFSALVYGLLEKVDGGMAETEPYAKPKNRATSDVVLWTPRSMSAALEIV